ncbi:cation:proton antiporter [Lutibaculum baratangense]|uniref:Glutathione-regulated potassium-efflux system protein KefB n=1 Tax=Lutibaculum baratangense AMV1 TaxID=631454 RepID=V4RUP2_9HYPH|nr:cation:proton antiporter [Lutibaculum baratangense]ESR26795.1 Glutathione-regulated potassium-efflux system protein KefB [Lutibaculum baratangense AMV1]
MEHATWVKDALVFLLVAGVVVPVFHQARLGIVLGFIAAGVLVGPHGLGRFVEEMPLLDYLVIEDPERVEPFAEFGVIFLLFVLGLELSFARLWQLRRYVLGVGTVQVVVTSLAIGAFARMAGASAPVAVVVGLTLALSSTAIVMQLLVEQKRLATQAGRVCLSVLLMQDMMVVPILLAVGMLSGGAESIWRELVTALVAAIAAVAVILLAGRFVLRPLLRRAAMTGSRDLIMAIVLLAAVGAAMGTAAAGLSAALGAFLAGLLLSESEYRHQIETDIEPFKGLLLGLFFTTVGMTIDLGFVVEHLLPIVASVAVILLVKVAVLFGAARLFAVGLAASADTAILLSQAGEFGFVVISLARGNGIVDIELAQFVFVVIGVTMALTPLLARGGSMVAARLEPLDHKGDTIQDQLSELSDHVIIGGFGRVGQTVARLLDEQNVPYVALDQDAVTVGRHRREGRLVFYGDAGRPEILDRAGAENARAFVVTLDDPGTAERMVKAAREKRPEATVYARARDAAHAQALARLGAVSAIPETVEGSLQLAGEVLVGLDIPDDVVGRQIEAERERARSLMGI